MWYKFAAFGTIDLQKYTSEKLGDDFDFEKELNDLTESCIDTRFGRVYFHILNKRLQSSELKKFISEFERIVKSNSIATFEPSTNKIGLRDLKAGETLEDLRQSIKHELRHSVDKGRAFRKDHVSNVVVDLAITFFNKYNEAIYDSKTGTLLYDQDKMLFIMANDYLSNEFGNEFKSKSNSYKSALIRQFLDQVVKRPDQTYEVLQRLAQGQSNDDVFNYFNVNNPQEYNTLLSDINDFYSPEIFQQYVNKFSDKENSINEIRSALSNPLISRASKILENISAEGEYLISKILKHTDNESMRRNVYKIIFDNFQQSINLQQPDLTKEAKKEYNAPRTGKKKKRWSVKHKRGIDCSNPKGFSAKQYCKRKRSGGQYKTEG